MKKNKINDEDINYTEFIKTLSTEEKDEFERMRLYEKRVEILGEPFEGGRVLDPEDVINMIKKVGEIQL